MRSIAKLSETVRKAGYENTIDAYTYLKRPIERTNMDEYKEDSPEDQALTGFIKELHAGMVSNAGAVERTYEALHPFGMTLGELIGALQNIAQNNPRAVEAPVCIYRFFTNSDNWPKEESVTVKHCIQSVHISIGDHADEEGDVWTAAIELDFKGDIDEYIN